ncbi:MAG: DnaD domain protein [Lachnospiraceae bacterium]|nr:DnaD domain protein [Lachnospiraceae bacterium]
MCKIVSENIFSGVTVLSNRFIDEYMVDADECALKVYIYLQRFVFLPGADVDVKKVAEALDITVTKTKKALKTWQSKGLLKVVEDEKGNVAQIRLLDIPAGNASAEKTAPAADNKKPDHAEADSRPQEDTVPAKEPVEVIFPKYSAAQMRMFGEDTHFMELSRRIEKLVIEKSGESVSFKTNELKTLAGIYECLGFSDELIEYLYSYCAERGKTSFKYIKAVATAWASEGITTVEEAGQKKHIYEKLLINMKKALGKRSDFGEVVVDEIESWVYDYGMDDEVIIFACNRAVRNGSDTPLNLVRFLINEWHNNNINTLEAAQESVDRFLKEREDKKTAGAAKKTTFASYEQREDSGNKLKGFRIKKTNVTAEEIRARLAKH